MKLNTDAEDPRLPGMPGPTMDDVRLATKIDAALEALSDAAKPMLQFATTVTFEKVVSGNKVRVSIGHAK